MADREETLRRLTLGDDAYLDTLLNERQAHGDDAALDWAGEALVKLGALAATDGSDLAWQQTVALRPRCRAGPRTRWSMPSSSWRP